MLRRRRLLGEHPPVVVVAAQRDRGRDLLLPIVMASILSGGLAVFFALVATGAVTPI